MNIESFDELKEKLAAIPKHRFDVSVKRRTRLDVFYRLKRTHSFNPDVMGFSLNNYNEQAKRCAFFDGEDVCIDIYKSEFISAIEFNGEFEIKMVKSTITVKPVD